MACHQAHRELALHQRDQLWAEAASRFQAGEPWWITDPSVLPLVLAKQEEARRDDALEALFAEAFLAQDVVTLEDILTTLKINPDRYDKQMQIRAGLSLKKIGFERKRRQQNGAKCHEWHRV